MTNKTNSFIAFLIPVMVVGSAFSDEAATQNWVKSWVPGWAENRGADYFIPADKESSFFTKRRGEVLSSGTAHQMRDLLYRHKLDTAFVPDTSMVKEGYELRTTGQTAFEGINEVLEKVDGNNGESGTAVTLETTAQNAFGAINELKGRVDNLNVPTATSQLTNDSNFVTESDLGDFVTESDLGDYALSADVPTKTSDLTNDSGFLTAHQDISGKADKAEIPTKTSDLTNDSDFVTETDLDDYALSAEIPTKTSDLTNDSGFVTNARVDSDSKYVYTTEGWEALEIEATFDPDFGG